jgi:ABC-type multidrug transport system ATPase subunit
MGIIVETANINLSAGGVTILDDLSFPFQEGETTVLMGPSGCGKSTLFKVMAGLMVPDSGQVYWEGEDLSYTERKANTPIPPPHGLLISGRCPLVQ